MTTSTRNMMTHRCSIERDVNHGGAGEDPYGNDDVPSWTDVTANVHCRFWHEGTRTDFSGNDQVEIETRKLVVPVDTVVDEDDRITEVRDRRGRLLAAGPMRIDGIGRRIDHLVLTMVNVR